MAIPVTPYAQLVRRFEAPPGGKLFCLHGDAAVFRLSMYAVSHALLRGAPIALVDGTNRFDVYYIAEFARRISNQRFRKKPVTPEQLLHNIHIARAFTCYQMEATITERLPEFLRRKHASIAVIFGLLDTFYDEQAPFFEVQAGVQRIIVALQQLKQASISVLLASQDVKLESKERNRLFPRLLSAMDHSVRLEKEEGVPSKRDAQLTS